LGYCPKNQCQSDLIIALAFTYDGVSIQQSRRRCRTRGHYKDYRHWTKNVDIFSHAAKEITTLSQNKNLLIINQVPEAGWHVHKHLKKMIIRGKDFSALSTRFDIYQKTNMSVNNWLDTLGETPNNSILRVDNIVCSTETNRCKTLKRTFPFTGMTITPALIIHN